MSLQSPCGTSQPRNIFSLVENEALLDTKMTSRAQAWLSPGGEQGLRRTESQPLPPMRAEQGNNTQGALIISFNAYASSGEKRLLSLFYKLGKLSCKEFIK